MKNLNRKITLYHIIFWLVLYSLWVLFFQNHSITISRTITVQFCYLIFIAADFYCINYVFAAKLLKKSLLLFIAVSLALITASAFLRALLASFMNANFFIPGKAQPLFSDLLFTSLLNIFIWVVVATVGKILFDKYQNQQYIALIEKEKALNELNFLKAQINPHFLFNSLNSIYGYIDKNNRTARNILLQFSEMLRYQLYDCNEDRISLSKELEYLRNYVALQQYRKEENLVVQFYTDENLNGLEIAPLLLVVFIENAFKYVSNFDDKENKIVISLTKKDNILNFFVCNTTENRTVNTGGGIGLTNAKRRLEILYPQKHEISINKEAESFAVQLKIDL